MTGCHGLESDANSSDLGKMVPSPVTPHASHAVVLMKSLNILLPVVKFLKQERAPCPSPSQTSLHDPACGTVPFAEIITASHQTSSLDILSSFQISVDPFT